MSSRISQFIAPPPRPALLEGGTLLRGGVVVTAGTVAGMGTGISLVARPAPPVAFASNKVNCPAGSVEAATLSMTIILSARSPSAQVSVPVSRLKAELLDAPPFVIEQSMLTMPCEPPLRRIRTGTRRSLSLIFGATALMPIRPAEPPLACESRNDHAIVVAPGKRRRVCPT